MKRVLLAAALLVTVFGFEAESQESVRAELTWFGTYTSGDIKIIDDPSSPTGKRHLSTGTKVLSGSTDRIAIAGPETNFGFGYRLTGLSNGARVRTIHIFRFPGNGIPGTDGRLQETTTVSGEDVVGDAAHIGWRMNGKEPKEYEGVWTLQVWSEQRLLLERKFTLYRP